MASAEARAGYAVNNCFRQDFRMTPNSSDQPSSVSKSLESDWTPSDSVDYLANSGCMPHNTNSDSSSEMKWWLHVKTNMGGDANYTCQHLNSWESELDAFSTGLFGDNVKFGGDESVKNFDALSCVGSATTIVSPKCQKKTNDTSMPKIEAALSNDLHLTPKKKNQEEFWFSDGQFVDCDITSFLVSEQCKKTSSDMEPHWMGAEKNRPWWRTTGKDDLASLVAQKSFDHIENCDLPQPHVKPFRKIPSLQPAGIDHDKNPLSSLNQKAEMCSSNANGCTSGTLTSGCSFQDSDRTFR